MFIFAYFYQFFPQFAVAADHKIAGKGGMERRDTQFQKIRSFTEFVFI